jgi:DNA end-binding protein Ku
MKGKKITTPTEVERPSNVVNLFEALKASVAAEKGGSKASAKKATKTATHRPAAKKTAQRKRA